jgi:hypothetical protein
MLPPAQLLALLDYRTGFRKTDGQRSKKSTNERMKRGSEASRH